jgi:septal ring factor EnvC (AmiA/AmiB activator)
MEASKRLQQAIDEMVKAAYEDMKSSLDSVERERCIMELKTGDNSIKSLEEQVKASNDKVESLEQKLQNVDSSIQLSRKQQILAAGIQNCEYNSFAYSKLSQTYSRNSAGIVRKILFSFQQGEPFIFPANLNYASFRNELSRRIQQLTGVKPAMRKEGDGRYSIHYSE